MGGNSKEGNSEPYRQMEKVTLKITLNNQGNTVKEVK